MTTLFYLSYKIDDCPAAWKIRRVGLNIGKEDINGIKELIKDQFKDICPFDITPIMTTQSAATINKNILHLYLGEYVQINSLFLITNAMVSEHKASADATNQDIILAKERSVLYEESLNSSMEELNNTMLDINRIRETRSCNIM